MVLSSSSVDSLAEGKSPYAKFFDQAKYALIGLPLLLVFARSPVHLLRKAAWPLLVTALTFQMMVFTPLGCGQGGNRNWVCLPGVSAQPSEAIRRRSHCGSARCSHASCRCCHRPSTR